MTNPDGSVLRGHLLAATDRRRPPSSAATTDIRVIDTTTGDLLRHLTLNPDRYYQPHQK